jgi:5-methylcytosine-specific restriction endonuclease McrA
VKPDLSILPAREPSEAEPRKAMTKSRRARVIDRFNGKCASPGCSRADSLEIDHTVPLELGGADEDHNLRPLCTYHHRLKTKLDVAMIAKARRLRKREAGEKRNTRPIPTHVAAWPPKGSRKIASRGFKTRKEPA